MEEIKLRLREAKELMEKAVQHAGQELAKLRAGKANPALLDGVMVVYYGVNTPLHQVASVTFPEARVILIKPWEKNLIPEIEKAILNANLGFTPQSDGQQVIINIPMLTEERRKQLVKQAHALCEQSKVSVRTVRKETNEHLKKIEDASEDDIKNAEADTQKLTDDFIVEISALMKKKETEIMTI